MMRLISLLITALAFALTVPFNGATGTSLNPEFNADNTTTSDPARTERFSVDGPVQLEVSTRGGWIEVERGSSDEVKVEMFVDHSSFSLFGKDQGLDRHRIVIQKRNNSIKAVADPRSQSAPAASFRITVPEETSAKLNSSGGSIKTSGISGKHMLESSDGSVEVSQTKGTTQIRIYGGSLNAEDIQGDLHVEMFGGSVNANRIDGEARIRSRGGSIKVLNLEGGLLVDNMGGSVIGHIKELRDGVKVDTKGGSIDFIINQKELYNLEANASQVMVYRGLNNADLLNLINQDEVRSNRLTELASDTDRPGSTFALSNGEVPVILRNDAGNIRIYKINQE